MNRIVFAVAVTLVASTSFVMGGMYGPRLIGNGTLTGWSVTHDGEEICDDPYIHDGSKEIECD